MTEDPQLARSGIGSLKVSPSSEFMWGRARISCVFLAVACVLSPGLGANALDAATNVDIGTNEIGAWPAQFELPPPGDGKQGLWTVVHDATAKAGLAIEQAGMQMTEDRIPLAIYKAAPLKNAEISLRLKTAGGKSDRGGGVAVRLKTPENYYLVQLDALRDRVLFSLVSNGASEEIVGVDADIALYGWHTLTVRAKDNEFVVSLDGIWMFTAFDKTLSQAGRIALWTEGDSRTRFDSISITPLPASEERY
jgi:hypothetical protein